MMKEKGPADQGLLDPFASESLIKRLNTAEVAAMATVLASDAGAGMTGSASTSTADGSVFDG